MGKLYTAPPAPKIEVTDEEVERAFKAMDAVFSTEFPDRQSISAEDKAIACKGVRAALEAVLKEMP